MAIQSSVPTFVGALACQRNPFLSKEFKTIVLSCEPTKKKAQYLVELKDTILFPEGGGQPSDSGNFLVPSTGEKLDVFKVSRNGLHAMHHVNGFIKPGTEVELNLNWAQRLDYMQQHTGQHLLSAVLEKEWGLSTVSWSMGGVPTDKKPIIDPSDVFNYVELNRKLTDDEISRLSVLCNEYITINPQKISVVERTADIQVNSEVDASKIPDDYDLSQGILRTIYIGDLDANPCCGTHLTSTTQLGSILVLRSQTSVRGTNSRLYFTCGSRVWKYASFANTVLTLSKGLLSCGEADIPNKVELQRDLVQKTSKKEQYWMKEVALSETEALIKSIETSGQGLVVRDENGGLDYLTQINKDLTSKLSSRGITDYKVILCGRDKHLNSGVMMILSNSGEEIASIAASLTEIVSTLKGGGGKKGGKWQGKISDFKKGEWESLVNYLEAEF